MAPGEKEREEGPAKSARRKIHTATLVISLARGWQQWANENSTRQAQEPTGWLPGGTEDPPEDLKPVIHPTPHQKAQSAPTSALTTAVLGLMLGLSRHFKPSLGGSCMWMALWLILGGTGCS